MTSDYFIRRQRDLDSLFSILDESSLSEKIYCLCGNLSLCEKHVPVFLHSLLVELEVGRFNYNGDSENMLYTGILEHLVLRDALARVPLHQCLYTESINQLKRFTLLF